MPKVIGKTRILEVTLHLNWRCRTRYPDSRDFLSDWALCGGKKNEMMKSAFHDLVKIEGSKVLGVPPCLIEMILQFACA